MAIRDIKVNYQEVYAGVRSTSVLHRTLPLLLSGMTTLIVTPSNKV